MPKPDRYQIGWEYIERKPGGYVLVLGEQILLIRDDGAMIDVSGAPIVASDIRIAQGYLQQVNGGDKVKNKLHQGQFPRL